MQSGSDDTATHRPGLSALPSLNRGVVVRGAFGNLARGTLAEVQTETVKVHFEVAPGWMQVAGAVYVDICPMRRIDLLRASTFAQT